MTVGWVSAVFGGAFETLPAGHAILADLATLRQAGLLPGGVPPRADQELTRYQAAVLWNGAYDLVTAPSARSEKRPSRPDLGVRRVVAAMLRLLDALAPELSGSLRVEPALARERLEQVPAHVASVKAMAPSEFGRSTPAGSAWTGLAAPPSSLSLSAATRNLTPFAANVLNTETGDQPGTRVRADLLGPASAGVAVRNWQAVEYDQRGPSRLLNGHVLAADLRLKMGDSSVLVEYGRSLFEQRFGALMSEEVGAQLKARFLATLYDRLTVDVGYGRMTRGFAPFASLMTRDGDALLSGLHGGLRFAGRKWDVAGRALYAWPDGTRDSGDLYNFGARARYRPWDTLSLKVGYETSARRTLLNLDSVWRDFVNAEAMYAVTDQLRAEVAYRFDTGPQRLGSSVDQSEHSLGVSLGMSF